MLGIKYSNTIALKKKQRVSFIYIFNLNQIIYKKVKSVDRFSNTENSNVAYELSHMLMI